MTIKFIDHQAVTYRNFEVRVNIIKQENGWGKMLFTFLITEGAVSCLKRGSPITKLILFTDLEEKLYYLKTFIWGFLHKRIGEAGN